MALFRSERGIGRGEVAESQIEAPFFAAFMVFAAVCLLIAHIYFGNLTVTLALAVTFVIFGLTLVRVDLGVYILILGMLLSPEINAGQVGYGERALNLRYNDFLIIVIFMGVVIKQAFEGRPILWRPSPVNAGILLYYGVCVISFLSAYQTKVEAWDVKAAAFVMLKMLEFYLIFFLVGNATNSADQIRKQLGVFFFAGLVVCAYCIAQIGSVDRVGAPFETEGTEPNTLGGYLVLLMSIAGALYVHAPTRGKRLLFLFLALAAFVPFLFTLSRASYIALIVCMFLVALLARRFAVLIALVALLALSNWLLPAEVLDRVNYTFQRGSGEEVVIAGKDVGFQVDKSTHERIYVWDKVWYNLNVWPWFGGGVGWGQVLDSQYARVLIETGLFGITSFLFMQYRVLRTTRQAYLWSTDWVSRGLSMGTFVVTVGLVVHSLGTITFLVVRIMEPFWFLVALTTVARANAIEEYVRTRALPRAEANPSPLLEPAPAVVVAREGRAAS
ncbi:MAG: O-antigen ligase family protein [Candidatus Hydrogenedentes bacterium]|nr:O-antigen ligase family protein [Candidatus Hydrogenedentota bacterium]